MIVEPIIGAQLSTVLYIKPTGSTHKSKYSTTMSSPPHVGLRRKGLKTLPRLPLSAFSPPSSGTRDGFPIPPSPSTIHPDHVIDGHVVAPTGDLVQWKQEAGDILGKRIGGVVLSLQGTEPAEIEKTIAG